MKSLGRRLTGAPMRFRKIAEAMADPMRQNHPEGERGG